jgi:hypothetical protein
LTISPARNEDTNGAFAPVTGIIEFDPDGKITRMRNFQPVVEA